MDQRNTSEYDILLVDNKEISRNTTYNVLTNAGYTVQTALHGKDGILKLKENHFVYKLVITEMIMPFAGGFEVIEYVKSNSKIPIMVLSSISDERTIEAVYNLEAEEFVRKPFIIADLLQKVRRLVAAPIPSEPNTFTFSRPRPSFEPAGPGAEAEEASHFSPPVNIRPIEILPYRQDEDDDEEEEDEDIAIDMDEDMSIDMDEEETSNPRKTDPFRDVAPNLGNATGNIVRAESPERTSPAKAAKRAGAAKKTTTAKAATTKAAATKAATKATATKAATTKAATTKAAATKAATTKAAATKVAATKAATTKATTTKAAATKAATTKAAATKAATTKAATKAAATKAAATKAATTKAAATKAAATKAATTKAATKAATTKAGAAAKKTTAVTTKAAAKPPAKTRTTAKSTKK